MKLNIEADVTPSELREFLGLPDIKPMQDEWLEDMNAKMQEQLKNLSPQDMMEKWQSAATVSPDAFLSMFTSLMSGGKDKS